MFKCTAWGQKGKKLKNLFGLGATTQYIFCAQHMIDLQHIQSEINLAIRLLRRRTLNGTEITASTLWNPQAIHQMVRNQVAYKFLQNIWDNHLTGNMSCMMY